jgi:23S rRNA U2552 (ribose-2'-O)-methylase RlmE/FtsJ
MAKQTADMVKKFAYELTGPFDNESDCDVSGVEWSRLLAENDILHTALTTCKNQISRYYHNRKWDNFKKFTNEYELVCTSSAEFPGIASHVPVSRSFFKMWEIMHDHATDLMSVNTHPMCAVFLAEGPGGFMESFAKYRADANHDGDALHGMTLISKHKSIPNWKVQSVQLAPHTRVRIHRGADGTGDLYNLQNIDSLVSDVGEASSDMVTADGGFDFSHDFNNQEDASMRLILAEVYAALRLQRLGGSLVLKVYDLHSVATLRILYVLRLCYGTMRLVKPLTSRPANSEKYAVCTEFHGASDSLMAALRSACYAGGTPQCVERHVAPVAPIPVSFLRDVVHYNTFYIARQACYIGRTISHIRDSESSCITPDQSSARIRRQLCKSIRWCHKYGISTSTNALLRYRPMMVVTTAAPWSDDDPITDKQTP